MKNIIFCLLLVLPSQAFAVLDPRIKVLIEEPAQGEAYSGVSNLRGWAVSPKGTGAYTFPAYIDGQFAFHLIPGGARADVGNVFPEYPESDASGFSMAFNYKDLSPGEHTLEIYAYDNDMNFNIASVTFIADRFVSGFISDPSKVDISTTEGVFIFDKHSFLVEGATVEGRRWDFLLSWDSASQGFKAEGIEPFGTYLSSGASGSVAQSSGVTTADPTTDSGGSISGGTVGGADGGSTGEPAGGDSGGWNRSLAESRRGISDTQTASGGLGLRACISRVTRSVSVTGERVQMDNGLVTVNGGGADWVAGEVHYVFRTERGEWFSMVWGGFFRQLDIVQEPSDCGGAPYFTSIEERALGSSKAYIFSNAEVQVPLTCGITPSDAMQVHLDQSGGEYLVSLRTAERCPVLSVNWT